MKKLTHTRSTLSIILAIAMFFSAFASIGTAKTAKAVYVGYFLEGKTVTKAMVKKVAGKFKSCKQVGKIVKPIKDGPKKGKFLLQVRKSNKKSYKNYYVNVDALKRIAVNLNGFTVENAKKFPVKEFKKQITVKAVYVSGKKVKVKEKDFMVKYYTKVLVNRNGYFDVTVKYGTKSKVVSIPVDGFEQKETSTPDSTANTNEPTATEIPMETPGLIEPVTTAPVVTPETETTEPEVTYDPTIEPVASNEPAEAIKPEPTPIVIYETIIIKVTPEPTASASAKPTASTKPSATPTAKPTASTSPSVKPTAQPSAQPAAEIVTLKLRKTGGIVSMNNSEIASDEVVEEFEKGEKVKLVATNTSDYQFQYWSDGKNVLSTDKVYEEKILDDKEIVAIFNKCYSLNITKNGKGKVYINDDEVEFFNNVANVYVVPGSYKIKAVASDDWYFVNFVNGKSESKNTNYNLSMAENINLIVTFAEKDKTVKVTFTDDTGITVQSSAVTKGETITPPTNGLFKTTKEFKGWKLNDTLYEGAINASEFYASNGEKLSDVIKKETAEGNVVNIVAYYVPVVEKFTLSINGGKIVKEDGSEIQNSSTEVEFGEKIRVIADVPEGKFFVQWVDSNGNKVNSYEDFNRTVSSDLTLIAVYEDVPVEIQPSVYFRDEKWSKIDGTNKVSFYMACEIPEGYQKVKWGLLLSYKVTDKAELNIDNSTLINKADNSISANSLNATLKYNVTFVEKAFSENRCYKAVVYATIISPLGEVSTIYSEMINVQL